jgi:hypothetical protein
MSDDRFDDGLVHEHHWAKEPPIQARPQVIIPAREDRYDEGLVHSHAWASTAGK